MSIHAQPRSPEVDDLSCIPETQQSQQAAGMEELVVRVEDSLEMSDTEQGGIALETQQDSDSSDEDVGDTQDTHATGVTEGQGQRQGQVKDQGRTRCNRREGCKTEAKKPLFCSLLRRSRN